MDQKSLFIGAAAIVLVVAGVFIDTRSSGQIQDEVVTLTNEIASREARLSVLRTRLAGRERGDDSSSTTFVAGQYNITPKAGRVAGDVIPASRERSADTQVASLNSVTSSEVSKQASAPLVPIVTITDPDGIEWQTTGFPDGYPLALAMYLYNPKTDRYAIIARNVKNDGLYEWDGTVRDMKTNEELRAEHGRTYRLFISISPEYAGWPNRVTAWSDDFIF